MLGIHATTWHRATDQPAPGPSSRRGPRRRSKRSGKLCTPVRTSWPLALQSGVQVFCLLAWLGYGLALCFELAWFAPDSEDSPVRAGRESDVRSASAPTSGCRSLMPAFSWTTRSRSGRWTPFGLQRIGVDGASFACRSMLSCACRGSMCKVFRCVY